MTRCTYGPWPDGAAPQIRASERNEVDVHTTRYCCHTAAIRPTAGRSVVRSCLRKALKRAGGATSYPAR